jgi:hypothetical protein
MVADLFDGPLPPGGATVATIGLPPGAPVLPEPAGAGPTGGGVDVVDLDAVDPATTLPDRRDGAVAVVARTLTDLRRATTLGALLPAATRITVAVCQPAGGYPAGPPAPGPGWPEVRHGRAGTGPDGSWSTCLDLAGPLPAGVVLAAVTTGMARHWRVPVAQVALAGPGAAHWRPGDAGARLVPPAGPTGPPPPVPVDLTLRAVPAGTPAPGGGAPVVDRLPECDQSWRHLAGPGGIPRARAVAATLPRSDRLPPYDERTVNPAGFLAAPTAGHGRLVQRGECWSVCGAGQEPVPIPPSGAVADADVRALRPVRSVAVEWGWHTGPAAAVRALAGLAGAGVPLHARVVPGWAAALGPELADLLTSVAAGDLDDDLRREEHSIRLRRAAFRSHSTQARWRQLAAAAGLAVPPPARISVLLDSDEPDRLGPALRQLARQRHVDLEVVLAVPADLAGEPPVREAGATCDRPLTVVPVPRGAPPGAALNRAAAVASGDLLARWQATDRYGPEYLSDLIMAAHYSGADLVGCFDHLAYLAQIGITVHRPGPGSERADRQVAEGAMLVDRGAFAEIGGFRPLPARPVEALARTLTAAGGTVYRTHGLAYMYHRPRGNHAGDVPLTHYLRGTGRQWRGVAPAALLQVPERDRTGGPASDL